MGDSTQESLTDWGAYPFPSDIRNLAMESMHEFGSRVGVWRILDSLRRHDVPSTFFACGVALEQAPEVARAAVEAGHEICSHGYRWEEVFRLSRDEEREHIRLAIQSIERTCGARPIGWYCRYGPSIHTRELLVEEGGFLYDSDAYNDEVPYFVDVNGQRHLVIPYTPDVNDIQFWLAEPLATAAQFAQYLRDTLDVLYREGARHPRMMSVGLHCRMIGRPGRIRALEDFIEYAKGLPEVWFATRAEIARWWLQASSETQQGTEPQLAESGRITLVPRSDGQEGQLGGGASGAILVSSSTVNGTRATVGRSLFPPGTLTEWLSHDTEEWMYVISGEGDMRTESGPVHFQAGDALYIPASVWHSVSNPHSAEVEAVFGFSHPTYPPTRRQPSGTDLEQ
jgi:peptidoglycan/xylan/chitin deacetylase (PgdA/CDA1 family)/mannose-6-phosphate isomerase-like protein (cupin superfamily)